MKESALTHRPKKLNILLIGDNCVDEYVYGTVNRISPEAPVPIFNPTKQESKPGMAGNVAENLRKLGCDVAFLHSETSKKIRIVEQRTGQHLIRIDEDVKCTPLEIVTALPAYDAIVVSDYNKGTVTYELIDELRKEFKGPIFIDTKKPDLKKFRGCFVKINETEYASSKSENDKLIVTLGGRGVMYKTPGTDSKYYEVNNIEVCDVTGAGDTFLSAFAFKYIISKDVDMAITFAIRAAEVTVQHHGVYAPSLEEIK